MSIQLRLKVLTAISREEAFGLAYEEVRKEEALKDYSLFLHITSDISQTAINYTP